MPGGRALLLLIALLLAAMSAAVLAVNGLGEDGARTLIRATARSSAVLLALAFAARPLRQLWRSALSAWLLRERRFLGLGFALSQLVHVAGIAWFMIAHGGSAPLSTWIGGGIGYLFTIAMAVTSTDEWVRRLTRKRWVLLHRTGMYVNVGIMLLTFGGGASQAEQPLPYLLAIAALLGASAIRIAAFAKKRSG